jgi:hypothetical protein
VVTAGSQSRAYLAAGQGKPHTRKKVVHAKAAMIRKERKEARLETYAAKSA